MHLPMSGRPLFALALVSGLALAACGDDAVEPSPVADVRLEPLETQLVVGDTARLTATVRATSGQLLREADLSWSSDDTLVATVTQEGLVRALSTGSALIEAEAGGARGSASIEVLPFAEEDVGFFARVVSLEEPERLEGRFVLTNRSARQLTLEAKGGCGVALLLAQVQGGPDVWDQMAWHEARSGGCDWTRQTIALDGGASVELRTPPLSSHDLMGDSLSSGAYRAAVRLELLEPAGAELVADAGELVLSDLERDTNRALQTGDLLYRLGDAERYWFVDIPFAFTNPTADTVYVAGCHPSPDRAQLAIRLERQEGGAWAAAWSPILAMCLSPPRHILPGASYTDTLRVIGGKPGENIMPVFHVDPIAGVYRLVWENLYRTYEHEPPFGERLTREQRLSNRFLLLMP